MEPFLADAGETLVIYFGMDAAHQSPYGNLYKDYIVIIIMTKNCEYWSLRKWLSQQHMAPQGLVYFTSFNKLVEMMNSENFDPDSYKSKSKQNNRKKKNKEDKGKEVVWAIIEPTELIPDAPLNDPSPTEQDSDSEASSEEDNSSEEDDEEADMRRVFALIKSWHYEDNDLFDPEAEEERQYADYDKAINAIKIIGCAATEPLYENDDYAHEDHTDSKFDDYHAMWPGGGPMPH